MSGSAADTTAWIVGCGDVGCRLALLLRDDGIDVIGFVRSESGLQRLTTLGIHPQACDLDQARSLPPQPPDWLFHFAPPPPRGHEDARLRALLATLPAPPKRLVYCSTSGVYGDCQGRWIDEDEPLKPAHDRAQRRVDAEQAVTEYAARNGTTAAILRAPGIYGPGRLRADRLREGRALVLAEQSPWSNRVHADDLAAAARLAARHTLAPGTSRAYNVADGEPLSMTDYLLRCAAVLGLPAPPQRPLAEVLAAASPMQREFLAESKRLVNRRAMAELGWRPRSLNDANGLSACRRSDLVVTALLMRPLNSTNR